MFVSLFPLPPREIHTTYFNLHPSVTSLPSITTATHRLPCLLPRQGKHVWLIVRQLMKADWWGAPLIALQDLEERICITTSNIHWLPQARFLIACPNFKLQSQKFFCLRPPIPHTPTAHFQRRSFFNSCWRSKENLSILGATQENLCTHPLAHKIFVPWFHDKNKKS